MRLLHQSVFVAFAAIFSGIVSAGVALAESRADKNPADVAQLTAALDDLDQWIGDGENGNKWRAFLHSARLRQQLAQGYQADPAVVARALQQYRSGASGLDKSRFVRVGRRLQTWLAALRNQHIDDLPKLAWAARGDHVPLTEESFAVVRTDLGSAAQQLENRLGVGTSLARGWKAYLQWSLLEPHFESNAKITGQSLRDLDRVLRRIRSNLPGLEHPLFVRTARALESYRELAVWYALGQRRDTRPRYTSFLLELEKQITRTLEKPTVESTRQIGKVLGLIHQLGHSPHLIQRVSAQFDRPNVWAEVSTTALQRLARRPVCDTTPVRDVILGARVRGTANSVGSLSLRTLPAGDHIALELQLVGNIQSRTFSYKKPVRVGSDGSTAFVATKRLHISDERFLVLPAAASAKTKTRIHSVKKTGGKFGRRLIEKIARKKVAEGKPQAERIAARHAERQIAEKFDRQVVDAVYLARQNYDNKFHPPLERIGMFPDSLQMASDSSGIQINATLASYKQISTHRLPPGIRVGNDITLQVHETALNNFLPHLLAGLELRQDEESEPPRITGDVPAWLKELGQDPKVKEQFVSPKTPSAVNAAQGDPSESKASSFKPWAFLLNNEHPASVSFDQQKMTLRIRIAELKTIERGEESVRKNWDFLVTYLLFQEGDRVVLRRAGDVQALPTGFDPEWFGDPRWNDKLTGTQVGVRKNLEENINKRAVEGGGFPLEIPLPPIELPMANGPKLSLHLQQLDCDDGWLTLGYRLP